MTLRKAAAFIAVALLLSCRPQPEVSINGQRFVVETAVTPQERSRGLMFRESLPKKRYSASDSGRRKWTGLPKLSARDGTCG